MLKYGCMEKNKKIPAVKVLIYIQTFTVQRTIMNFNGLAVLVKDLVLTPLPISNISTAAQDHSRSMVPLQFTTFRVRMLLFTISIFIYQLHFYFSSLVLMSYSSTTLFTNSK